MTSDFGQAGFKLHLKCTEYARGCQGKSGHQFPRSQNVTLNRGGTIGRINVIEVRDDVRKEKDGPMLIHGLQSLHSNKIVTPRSLELAPDPKLLEERFELFREAG